MVAGKEVVPAAEGNTVDAVVDGKVEALQGIPVTDEGNDETPVAEGVNAIAAEGDDDDDEGVKWLKHYSSVQSILTVGDGDFSFSRALATAFGSGENLVATSLDTNEDLRSKYRKAESNITELKRMGATVLHGVNAKRMKDHTDLKVRRFDRIVFNFPHAGFKGNEDSPRMISSHKELVRGFFRNVRRLLRPSGEIHVNHKTGRAYDKWDIEQLASEFSFIMVEKVDFQIEDYPGYNHKRGDGRRCDKPFALGPCYTYKFSIGDLQKEKKGHSNRTSSISISLGGRKIRPELSAPDRRPSRQLPYVPVWHSSHFHAPLNTVNMPLTLKQFYLGTAQRYQPGFPDNFGGLLSAPACFLQQGNIQPMCRVPRPLPNLLPAVGSNNIAPPMGRITRPWGSAGFYSAGAYQMSLQREFAMKKQEMPAGTSFDYLAFLEDRLRDPVEKEEWIQSMITLYATR
ncbi:hypothetical protein ABZP36_034456 [Zizania latifolia]